MASTYHNRSLLQWAVCADGDGNPVSSELWEHAPLPPKYLAVNSLQALKDHVAPPRQLPICHVEASPEPLLLDVDIQSENRSHSLSTGVTHEGTRGIPPSRQTSPNKRQRHKRTSDEMQRYRTDSAKQRSLKSSGAVEFWRTLQNADVIQFLPGSAVVSKLATSLLDMLSYNNHPGFLGSHNALLIDEENCHSALTETAKSKLRSGELVFETYKQREEQDAVTFHTIGGNETGSTAATMFGICRLANNYVSHAANFKPNILPAPHRYRYSPQLSSGISDLSVRSDPDPEEHTGARRLKMQTPFMVEIKLNLTHRDMLVLVYVLRTSSIDCRPKDGLVLVEPSRREHSKLLSSAVKQILGQIFQQFHVNKARYILLATPDVSILFELASKFTVLVSGLICRDYETYKPRFSSPDSLEHILEFVEPRHRENMIQQLCKPATPMIEDPEFSQLWILVAGLVAVPAADANSNLWLTQMVPLTSTQEEGESSTNATQRDAAPSQSRSHSGQGQGGEDLGQGPTSGTDGIQGFSISIKEISRKHLQERTATTTHVVPFDRLHLFQWECLSVAGSPTARLSSGSDATTSSIPSLTTDTGSADTGHSSDHANSPTPPPISAVEYNSARSIERGQEPGKHSDRPPDTLKPQKLRRNQIFPPIMRDFTSHRQHSKTSALPLVGSDLPQDLIDVLMSNPTGSSGVDMEAFLHPQVRTSEQRAKELEDILGPGFSKSSSFSLESLEVYEYVGSGRLWDVYRAKAVFKHPHFGTRTDTVVVKFCLEATYPEDENQDDDMSESVCYSGPYTRASAVESIKNELAILEGPLIKLQGKLCPILHGLWVGRVAGPYPRTVIKVHCMVLEDCGKTLRDEIVTQDQPAFTTGTLSDRLNTIDAFSKLHSRNILHGDISLRNVLRNPRNGSIRLIDFEASSLLVCQGLKEGQQHPPGLRIERVSNRDQLRDILQEESRVVFDILGLGPENIELFA
ncbi:hypothetical protein IAU60_006923 [Kwoniella sp. DSM 27419]